MERDVRFAFLRRLQDQLRREAAEEVAKRDALTGLANRRYLEETVESLKTVGEEDSSPVAVVMVDIDHFKPFNDRYGHVVGDVCIKRVAAAIAAECRNESDLAVRLGGEEFLMLLPRTEMSEAVRVAERLRRQVEELGIPHEGLGTRGVVTVSLGVMAGSVAGQGFAELLTGADTALYAAKRNGRNQVWPPFVRRGGAVAHLRGAEPVRTAERTGSGTG
jgi:diguanylate cyclase (GGDEF)-like protein